VPRAQLGGNSYATWCLAAWIATHKRGNERPRSICGRCTGSGG
jgi:hypothetical protein